MKICVLGGGVIGITTAIALARCGHRVTVLDKQSDVGMETSFANGGQLSYSYVAPLANPGVFAHLPGWLARAQSPLRFAPRFDVNQWRWCLSFLRACTSARSLRTTADLLALGAYSRLELHRLLAEETLAFDFRQNGKLVIYRDEREWAAARRQMDYQALHDSRQLALDAKGCVDREPALACLERQIIGGVFTSSEEVGDCYRFTTELARVGRERYGVEILTGLRVEGWRVEAGSVRAIRSSRGEIEAEGFVVALGNASRALLRPLGLSLPVYPLQGYSLTSPVEPHHTPPQVSITDLHHKIVYAKIGGDLRVAGMADLGPVRAAPRLALLARQARETLPDAADYAKARAWTGARPATPDSKPVIAATDYHNLWLNTGHGSLGFTFACGSAALLTALVNHTPPEISVTPYGLDTRHFM